MHTDGTDVGSEGSSEWPEVRVLSPAERAEVTPHAPLRPPQSHPTVPKSAPRASKSDPRAPELRYERSRAAATLEKSFAA